MRCTSIPPRSCCLNEAPHCVGGKLAVGHLWSTGMCPALAHLEAVKYGIRDTDHWQEMLCFDFSSPPSSTTHPFYSPNAGSSGKRGQAAKGLRTQEPRWLQSALPLQAQQVHQEPSGCGLAENMGHQHCCWRNLRVRLHGRRWEQGRASRQA